MIKRILKYLVFLVVGLIIALILLPFVFKDEIKDGVRQALNESLNVKSDFKDISLSFFKDFPNATIRIDYLRIDGIDTFDQVPLFHTKSASIEVALSSLLQKNTPYQINSVEIDQPLVNIVQLANGKANYLITKGSESDQAEYQIALKGYKIIDGTVYYQDQVNEVIAIAKHITHSGKGEFTQAIYDLNTNTMVDTLYAEYNGIPMITDGTLNIQAILNVDIPENKYTFAKNQIKLNEVLLNFTGFLQMKEEGILLDLSFESPQADFGEIYSLVPYAFNKSYAKADIKGDGRIAGIVQGRYNADKNQLPHYDFQIIIDRGSVKYPDLPKNISNISANINLKNDRNFPENILLNVPNLNITMGQDYLRGSFSTLGQISNPRLAGELAVNLNLADWKDALPFEAETTLEGQIQIDIRLATNLKAIAQKQYDEITFTGNVLAENVLARSPGTAVTEVELLRMEANPKLINGTLTKAVIKGSDISGDFRIYDPLSFFTKESEISGFVNVTSNTLDLNPYLEENSDTQEIVNSIRLPKGKISINARANNLLLAEQNYQNNEATGFYQDGNIIISDVKSFYGESDFTGSGQITNLESYLNRKGALSGDLILVSKKLNVNDFMTKSETASGGIIAIPPAMNINIAATINALQYQDILLNNVKGKVVIADEALAMDDFNSTSMGGNLIFEGLYATPGATNPNFNMKVDLSKIQFGEAFRQLKTFRMLAPAGKFIDGIFNSTLVMNAKLGKDMMPIWSSLNASGYMETIDGAISGYGPIDKIGSKIGLESLKSWTITNTKNWIEVDQGVLLVKEKTYDIGDNIEVNFSGSHVIGGNMDYQLIFSIPRELLKNSSPTALAESGLSAIENEAKKVGINLEQGANLLVRVNLKGLIDNPNISFTPVGTSGKRLKDIAKEELAKKQEEAVQKIKDEIAETKKEVKDTIRKGVNQVKDSIASELAEKKEALQDTLEQKVKNEVEKRLDSLKQKTAIDSVAKKADDLFKESTVKDVDKLKEELKKWNPFKKKKPKSDTLIKNKNG